VTGRLVLGASHLMSVDFYASAWTHPANRSEGFATLSHWQELARVLEDGGFDFLFFADVIGYPMGDSGTPDAVLREAVQMPAHDPVTIVSALAATVQRLNFVVTSSTTVEQPFMLARRYATLDHLTGGRVGWNIVNSDNQKALVRLLGLGDVTAHDRRYDRAEEFVDLVCRLWEGSWEDDAVVFDRNRRTFAEPGKVHEINHHGEFFDLDGRFTVVPSPQRTPTLFQAGASPRGRDFAAATAECVYVQGTDAADAAATVADLRARAVAHGRRPQDLKVLNGVSVVVGATEDDARRKRAELTAAPSTEALAMHFLGWTGINLLELDPELPIDQRTEYGHSTMDRYERGPVVREVLEGLRDSLGGLRITGDPASVADQLEGFAEESGVDGFLVEPTFGGLEEYREFTELVVPLLRQRGLVGAPAAPTTLRQTLFGGPDGRVGQTHRAARHRVGAGRSVARPQEAVAGV